MEINTRDVINGKMCYVCKNTFVQFRKIKYLNLCGDLVQSKPRVICYVCKINRENNATALQHEWNAFRLKGN